MTGFIVSVFPFRNRVSFKEAFEGLELGEGKLSRPVLRGPGGRKAAWLLGSCADDGLRTGLVSGSTIRKLWRGSSNRNAECGHFYG
jgi:hypothetical protein